MKDYEYGVVESFGKYLVLQVITRNEKGEPAGRVVLKLKDETEARAFVDMKNRGNE